MKEPSSFTPHGEALEAARRITEFHKSGAKVTREELLMAVALLASASSEKTPQGYPVPCAGGLWDERPYGGEGDSIPVCSICNQPAGDHRDIVAVPSAIPASGEVDRLKEALRHVLWIKDCGVDGRDEKGVFRNWPETERDAMYKIAKDALEGKPSIASGVAFKGVSN